MANFNINDNAYFIENWTDNVIGGKVLDVRLTRATDQYPSEPYLVIKIEGSRYDKREQLVSKCYPMREAALAARDSKNEETKNKYREQIQTPEDLVRFMYDYTVSCAEEYTDWEARAVAAEKAKEFFGLELD